MVLRVLFSLLLICPPLAQGGVDSCLATLRPYVTIGEKDLLDVPERWRNRRLVEDGERELFLRNSGYADSTGNLSSKIKLEELVSCSTDSLSVKLLRVVGNEGTKDENIYIVTYVGKEILSRTLIASLQATCDNTFLRGCSMMDDGSIRVGQLRHAFDCEKDEFLKTEQLAGLSIRIRDDGSITEIVDE